jgi:DNA-nicking Smr family endonuclease
MTRNRKGLSDQDLALWRHVARSVRARPGRELPPIVEAAANRVTRETITPVAPLTALPSVSKPSVSKPSVSKPSQPPLAPFERRVRSDLKRGLERIDAVLDLHGLTQARAHAVLGQFLVNAQLRGARHVLVITGKGAEGSQDMFGKPDERGVLRRVVPHWLRLPDLRPFVLGFEEASHKHGGSGALYVRLRRSGRESMAAP